MGESLEDKLARISDEAEAGEDDQTDRPIPAGVKVSQPNRVQARSRTLQVRLTEAEYEALELLAAAQREPVSAFARDELLESLRRAQVAAAVSVSGAVAVLEQVAQLVASLDTATAELRNQIVHQAVAVGPGTRFLGNDPDSPGPRRARATTLPPYEVDPAD